MGLVEFFLTCKSNVVFVFTLFVFVKKYKNSVGLYCKNERNQDSTHVDHKKLNDLIMTGVCD